MLMCFGEHNIGKESALEQRKRLASSPGFFFCASCFERHPAIVSNRY